MGLAQESCRMDRECCRGWHSPYRGCQVTTEAHSHCRVPLARGGGRGGTWPGRQRLGLGGRMSWGGRAGEAAEAESSPGDRGTAGELQHARRPRRGHGVLSCSSPAPRQIRQNNPGRRSLRLFCVRHSSGSGSLDVERSRWLARQLGPSAHSNHCGITMTCRY